MGDCLFGPSQRPSGGRANRIGSVPGEISPRWSGSLSSDVCGKNRHSVRQAPWVKREAARIYSARDQRSSLAADQGDTRQHDGALIGLASSGGDRRCGARAPGQLRRRGPSNDKGRSRPTTETCRSAPVSIATSLTRGAAKFEAPAGPCAPKPVGLARRLWLSAGLFQLPIELALN